MSLSSFKKKKKKATNRQPDKAKKPKLFATFREPKLQNGTIFTPDTYQETRERRGLLPAATAK